MLEEYIHHIILLKCPAGNQGVIDIQKVQGKQVNLNEESMTTVVCGNNTTSKRVAKDTAKVAM